MPAQTATSSLRSSLRGLKPHEAAFLDAERQWLSVARDKQVMPLEGWNLLLAMCGRGWGKTQVGAAWTRRCVGTYPGCIVHVVAPTYADLRGVIFGGESGLLDAIPPAMIKTVNHSLFEIELHNGAWIKGFSAEAPNRLRGPQCHFLWGDEIAAWGTTAEDMLTNIDMSTRLTFTTSSGRIVQPQRFYTTTPRPLGFLKEIVDRSKVEDNVRVVTGSTYENKDNLADAFIKELSRYEDTQIGRQEIHGELLDIGESAIIKRSWLKIWPHGKAMPWFDFIIVSMDTALTERTFDRKTFEPDFTASTIWGIFAHERRWNMLLLEAWRDRIGFPQLIERARKDMSAVFGRRHIAAGFAPLIGPPKSSHEQVKKPDLLIIEDKGSGISLRQMLANEGQDSWPYNPGHADKLSRLHGVSHIPAAGRIWLPESQRAPGAPRDWCRPLLDEVCVYSGPGTTKHDDWVDSCLLGSTLVVMGDETTRPLSDVKTGDEVMTPLGPRRVLQAGATGVKSIWCLEWESGRLEGTGNHPVWADGGWRRLDSLYQGSIIQGWHSQKSPASASRPSFSMATGTTDILTPPTPPTDATLLDLVIDFIATCGSTTRGLFQRIMTFIIMTRIPATTTYRTCAACLPTSMQNDIEPRTSSVENLRNRLLTWLGSGARPPHGTPAPRDWNGTGSTPLRASSRQGLLVLFQKLKSGVVNARGAPSLSGQSSTVPNSAVRVVRLRNLGTAAPVYNLRVEEAECYYANGILVHNCSQAWRYFADHWMALGIKDTITNDSLTLDVEIDPDHPAVIEHLESFVEPPYG